MIETQTAFEAWKKILETVLQNGRTYTDTRGRKCSEVENMLIRINNPQHQVTVPMEYVNHLGDWIYPSAQEIADITLAKHPSHIYGYVYGSRIFAFGEKEHQKGINQINDFIIPLLQKDPSSRRAVAVFVDPQKDSFPQVLDIPSVISMQCRVIEEKLHMTLVIRSNDMFIGWPANIFQSSILQDYISSRLNVGNGSITIHSLSAHVFGDQIEAIKQVIKSG